MASQTEAKIVLKELRAEHLVAANALSEEKSWPQRLEDWELFYELGKGIVAMQDDRVVGTILAFRYRDDYASLGMLIEAADLRGSNIARTLMIAMLDRLGSGVNVLICGTPERMSLYYSLGFTPYNIIHQHQGPAPSMPLAVPRDGERVRPMGKSEPDLAQLYNTATGIDRSVLFSAFVRDCTGNVLCRDHDPVGFALLRRFGRGRIIAPVIAPDFEGAKLLATQLLGERAGHFCRIDVVEGYGMSKWLDSVGLPKVDTATMMVRGTPPILPESPTMFAIAAQTYG